MDKLQMCRICLAQNVQMYVVVNKKLYDLYGKLTGNPFVTEDRRPILACFICCAQLKKCYRFKKKCLEAEEMFAKMMNEEYERKPLINQDQFELFHGFIRTPIDTISLVDVDQTESIVVKEELPAVCERLDDIIETNEEHDSEIDLKTVNIYDNYLDVEVPPLPHSESDSEDDVPLIDVSTEIEKQESSTRKRKSEKTYRSNNEEISISRITLVSYYRECNSRRDVDKMHYLCKKVANDLKVPELSKDIKSVLGKMIYTFKQKLEKSHRHFGRFKNSNKNWFETNVKFSVPTREQKKKK